MRRPQERHRGVLPAPKGKKCLSLNKGNRATTFTSYHPDGQSTHSADLTIWNYEPAGLPRPE